MKAAPSKHERSTPFACRYDRITSEDRDAAQLRAAEVAVAAGRMSEDDLRELREFNETRDIDSDGAGGVRE